MCMLAGRGGGGRGGVCIKVCEYTFEKILFSICRIHFFPRVEIHSVMCLLHMKHSHS